MNPQSTFLPIAIAVYGLVAITIFLMTRMPTFKAQSEEDQLRARKQFKIVLLGTPVGMGLAWMLLGATAETTRRIPVLLYFGLWAVVVWHGWKAYRLGIKRDHSKVKARNGKPLQNPEALVSTFATVNAGIATALSLFLILVPLARIPFSMWAPAIAAIVSVFNLVVSRIERKNGA